MAIFHHYTMLVAHEEGWRQWRRHQGWQTPTGLWKQAKGHDDREFWNCFFNVIFCNIVSLHEYTEPISFMAFEFLVDQFVGIFGTGYLAFPTFFMQRYSKGTPPLAFTITKLIIKKGTLFLFASFWLKRRRRRTSKNILPE
jgi:hypothetical protein